MSRAPRWLAILVAPIALLVACGGEDESDDIDPSRVPPGAVAIVGDEVVSKTEFDRRLAMQQRASVDSKPPTDQLRMQAMMSLLRETALAQEARERGVALTKADTRRLLRLMRTQFPSPKAYRDFLGEQTEAEVMAQLRVQQLMDKLADQAAEQGEDPEEYARDFHERWRAVTVCGEAYVVPTCANPPAYEKAKDAVPLDP